MITLHRAERADTLVRGLADLLAQPPADPMAPELVAVHSRGIERWLAQELSARLGATAGQRDGVAANIDFPFPSRVVGLALAAVTGLDATQDPWLPQRLVWPLLELLDAHLDQAWLAPLRVHLGDGGDQDLRRGRRFGAARHLADLFDRYGVHRPVMLQAWAQGLDIDGRGADLPDELRWQAVLWRLVGERLGVTSPAERLLTALPRLRAGLAVPQLPDRLSLFGLTALPASYVAVLAALAERRDVHLFVLHPSPELWDRVAARLPDDPALVLREHDDTRGLPVNPLLAAWGRDVRELQLVLAGAGGVVRTGDVAADPTPSTPSLLQLLQSAIRSDHAPAGLPLSEALDERTPLGADDRSLQVHSCHGRTRQVEVLRDAILHLLVADPTLQPRDVIVLCPDIEQFAPVVSAVFASDARDRSDGLPDLRVRLADRALRQTNPLLRVVSELLTLTAGRVTASEVLDLAAREPVRRRFRLDDSDLERLGEWVADAGIRWGMDAGHREAFGLGTVGANTWRAGLDRLLLGVTMADEQDRVFTTVPLDDVEGSDVDLAGRLAELMQRLDAAIGALAGPLPIAEWRAAITVATDALTATGQGDGWQRLQLHRILDDVVAEATIDNAPSTIALTLAEVRGLLDDRLRGRPTRANHRTGDLTVCTLVPMRSVPHRVVCLLGMDDGAFPRRTAVDGDDLIDRDPFVGDRDARTEDRQLLLDALLAASDAVVITFTGRDVRTNEPRPPAVPVGELLDVVDRTVHRADGGVPRAAVVVEHPLQAFDPRNFHSSPQLGGQPFGFDPVALSGAAAKVSAQPAPAQFLSTRLPLLDDGPAVALDQLVTFFDHPVRAFLRRRLGVSLPRDSEEPSDSIPVELAPLDRYAVGDRLLASRLGGTDIDRWTVAERARGLLPPGTLADAELDDITDTVEQLLEVAAKEVDLGIPRTSLEVVVPLASGRSVLGTVAGVAGDVLLSVQYSRVAPKHRLAAWIRLLAATAVAPQRPLSALTIGRLTKKNTTQAVTIARIGPLPGTPGERQERAVALLGQLVDLSERGLRAPLPLYALTSAAWAQSEPGDARTNAARSTWTTDYDWPKEDQDPEHQLIFDGVAPFEQLLAEAPLHDERLDGWPSEESRLGCYALRLWQPLLEAEELVHQ